MSIVRITGELSKDRYDVQVVPWKLLLETNRYYEIKPEQGAVKRIYKEKLNTATIETKQYANGTLSCSAFCTEDRIEELQRDIVKQLQTRVIAYMEDLQLNQVALNRQLINLEA
ncbi:hypothetical protein [Cohnella terricola]|uniref:Uncharacterized protein n=1 Tax=Cohnella terricola TaxID=1289167 RepID=A0A559JTW7_9BACL|nr:hypothetical protein [Cohnella terricola]TVY03297.1 hypothetical protein FPZ45_05330 [Cohnella terricola]